MKTIKSILLGIVLVCATTLSAAEKPKIGPDVRNEVSKEIALLLKSPSFEVKEEMNAFISLVVNDENEIVVLSVESDNEVVENFVKSRLNYRKMTTHLEGSHFKVPLKITSTY